MTKKWTKVLTVVLAAMLILSACGPAKDVDNKDKQPKTVTLAIASTYESLMPFNTTNNYSHVICDQIYDRLVFNRGDGKVEPRLASEWKVADDKKAITFTINDKAKWHDGQPVTAEDVVFTCKLITNPKIQATSRQYFQYFEGTNAAGEELSQGSINVTADSKNDVTFHLKKAMDESTILNIFNRYFYVLPKHIFEGKSVEEVNAPDIWAKPVGSGPFKYSSEIAGDRVELEANKDFHLGAPKFDRLVIRVIPSANLLSGLMSGEVDILAGAGLASIPLQDWSTAKNQENLNCSSVTGFGYQYMSMDTQKEYLTPKVRQAINIAINREVLVNSLLQGEGQVIAAPLTPKHPYCNKELIPPEYNPEKAAQMLKEENWDESRELLLMVPTGNQVRERSAPLIQQDLAKVGVKVKIQMVDFPTLMNSQREGKTDFGLIGSAGSIDPDESSSLMNPKGMVNFSRLKDDSLYALLQKGIAGTSFEERKPIYDEYQVKLKELSPMAWLYSANDLIAYNKRISNVKPEDFNNINWATWEWEVK